MENENIKKTYTQDEVNSIVEQVKARQQEKFAKKIENSYVELDKYNELQSKINEMDFKNKSNNFKDTFINNGGNASAYNDFINLNKDILSLDNEGQIKKLNEIRESKPYFFNNDNKEIISNHNVPIPNGDDILKKMLKDNTKNDSVGSSWSYLNKK